MLSFSIKPFSDEKRRREDHNSGFGSAQIIFRIVVIESFQYVRNDIVGVSDCLSTSSRKWFTEFNSPWPYSLNYIWAILLNQLLSATTGGMAECLLLGTHSHQGVPFIGVFIIHQLWWPYHYMYMCDIYGFSSCSWHWQGSEVWHHLREIFSRINPKNSHIRLN